MKIKFTSSAEFNPSKLSPVERSIVKGCEAIPDGEVVDSYSLASKLNVSEGSVSDVGARPFLQPFSEKVKGKRWYGNARTIAELRKQFEKDR